MLINVMLIKKTCRFRQDTQKAQSSKNSRKLVSAKYHKSKNSRKLVSAKKVYLGIELSPGAMN